MDNELNKKLEDKLLHKFILNIERQNECDYCLCVDGDMFCYWQCSTKPLSNIISTVASYTDVTPAQVTDVENSTSVLSDKYTINNVSIATELDISMENVLNSTAITQTNITAKANNQTCFVTGKEYLEGDIVPQEEGSCLQCVCGSNGRVTCSPQGCVSLQQDRYRHGIESNSLDMFDVDVF
ncbi:hypothetical protein PGB90_010561 [Kerria lacca]